MALTVGAMTGGFAAAATGERKRARKRVVREVEAGQKPARTAARFNCNRAAGGRNISVCHLPAIIPADKLKDKT
jgi:hypothetical protein